MSFNKFNTLLINLRKAFLEILYVFLFYNAVKIVELSKQYDNEDVCIVNQRDANEFKRLVWNI